MLSAPFLFSLFFSGTGQNTQILRNTIKQHYFCRKQEGCPAE